MSKREYPRQAWVLSPSFKPKEVTIVKSYQTWRSASDWDVAESGKQYHFSEMFETEAAAIASGREQVQKAQADIDKRQANLNKRIAQLDAADGKGSAA